MPGDGQLRYASSRRRGLTLVEVVAALVVMGILLALLAKASGQYAVQQAAANERLVAARGADRLIASWMEGGDGTSPSVGWSGTMAGLPLLRWDTVEVPSQEAAGLGAKVVRLRVFGADGPSGNGGTGSRSAEAIVTVDLLVSVLPPPARAQPPEGEDSAAGGAATQPATGDDREDPRLLRPPHFRRVLAPAGSGAEGVRLW